MYYNLRAKNLIDLSLLNPCCPSLEHIVIWCEDIWRYYHSFYLQVTLALTNLEYENEDTVNALLRFFKEDFELKKAVNKIRSFNFSSFEFIYQNGC